MIFQNWCSLFAPSTSAASYRSFGITCRPASKSSATNGVVFQMSTAQTAPSAVLGSEIHACACAIRCRRTPRSLTTPKTSSSIHFHICAATTVGIAHGTSMTARMTPRPLNFELTTSATIRPSTNSKATVMIVNLTVVQIESRKNVSWSRFV